MFHVKQHDSSRLEQTPNLASGGMFHVKHRFQEFPSRARGRWRAAGNKISPGRLDKARDFIGRCLRRVSSVISPKLAPPMVRPASEDGPPLNRAFRTFRRRRNAIQAQERPDIAQGTIQRATSGGIQS